MTGEQVDGCCVIHDLLPFQMKIRNTSCSSVGTSTTGVVYRRETRQVMHVEILYTYMSL